MIVFSPESVNIVVCLQDDEKHLGLFEAIDCVFVHF